MSEIVERLVITKHGPGVVRVEASLTRLQVLKREYREVPDATEGKLPYQVRAISDAYALTPYIAPLEDLRDWEAWGEVVRRAGDPRPFLRLPVFLPVDILTRMFR